MEKNFWNYNIYPTVSEISRRDTRTYRVEAVSKEEIIQRIEILEGENKKIPKLEAKIKHLRRVEAEVERLKQVEQRMVAMEAMLAQLTSGNVLSLAGPTKENVFPKDIASTTTAQVSRKLQLKKGDSFTFGKYQGKPIKWQVLDVIAGKALLISRYGLDAKPYNERRKAITWEQCILRQWLNQEFYKNAFSVEEQRKIHKVKLENPDNSEYGTAGGNNTEDQVFLLSIAEAKKYLDGDFARTCIPTVYAKTQGADVDKKRGSCRWWLRSPGNHSNTAAVVLSSGSVYSGGRYVFLGSVVVRPVLWINLES